MKRIELTDKEKERIHGPTHFKAIPTGRKLLYYIWYELTRNNQ